MSSRAKCRADRLMGVALRMRKMKRHVLRSHAAPVSRAFTRDEWIEGVEPNRWLERVKAASVQVAPHGLDVRIEGNDLTEPQVTVHVEPHVRPPQYAPPILS